jgi:hypothetical protein
MGRCLPFRILGIPRQFGLVLLACSVAWGQGGPPKADEARQPLEQSIQELQRQIGELRSAVSELRSETNRYHDENLELRRQLQAMREEAPTAVPAGAQASQEMTGSSSLSAGAGSSQPDEDQHPASIAEQIELLNGKLDEQYQTKVESASKYRIRLSGIVLFNLFGNHGNVENIDIPHLAIPGGPDLSQSNLGGSLRQSQLGLEVFGPRLAGAKTTGNLQFDFAGGFARLPNGVTSGLVRLRTATLRMDWENTSIVGGQDALFFAPLSPTSLASLAIPALAYSGNLWSWTPQLRIEHRFKLSGESEIQVQAGILDPLTGEAPITVSYRNPPLEPFAYRAPQAGEASGAPGIASRVAWSRRFRGQPLTIGAGGYYSRQDWGFNRKVDGWAATTDLNVPLSHMVSLSAAFYRGRAVGGLGGGIGRSVLFNAGDPSEGLRPLDAAGGWAQLKFRPLAKLEFNAAFGQDDVFSNDARAFPAIVAYYDQLTRNRGAFANFIYHPRSDLLFSMEYQRLRTSALNWPDNTADHVNMSMGVLF